MVKLHPSLLAVTLAIGSALAFPAGYQRRSEIDVNTQVESRGFEHEEDLVVRQPTLNLRFGLAAAGMPRNSFQSRALEDNDDLFDRDILDELEAREPFRVPVGAWAKAEHMYRSHRNTIHHVAKGASFAQDLSNSFQGQSRSLEDDEGLFERDLDSEELFEREYDLEAREPFRVPVSILAQAEHMYHRHEKTLHNVAKGANRFSDAQQFVSSFQGQSRSLEDDEGLFERDLDSEELFERGYDLFDDLD
jgi:hypothetical protein